MLEGPSSELPLAWPELQDKQTWFQDSLASDFWSVEDQRKDSALHDFCLRFFWCPVFFVSTLNERASR